MSAAGSSDAVPDDVDVESGSLPQGVKVAITSFTEREMELGIENNALRKTLEAARAGWKAEVKRLRDGRRERIASRVLAALVGTEPWVAIEEANVDAHIERMEHLVRRATVIADIQVLALDNNPPLSVHTDRVR